MATMSATRCCKPVASCLKDMTRYHDVVARLGGEEFAVVAPNLDDELLLKLAERIRKAIAAMAVQADTTRFKITTSVGLAVWNRRERPRSFTGAPTAISTRPSGWAATASAPECGRHRPPKGCCSSLGLVVYPAAAHRPASGCPPSAP